MSIEELAELCRVHELIKDGNRNCKGINKVYKTLPNARKTMTKNNKINAINKFFDQVADYSLAAVLTKKYVQEGKIPAPTGETETNSSGEVPKG